MLSDELKAAYRNRRASVWYGPVVATGAYGEPGKWQATPNKAVAALAAARADIAAGKRRCGAPAPVQYNPAMTEGADKGARWIENAAPWLRFAGYADELAGRAVDHTGWYADFYQDSTYRGAVYLLPGRNGETIAAPGYADPHNAGAAFIDFGNLQRDIDGAEAKRSAALAADDLARRHAEAARDYDTAWQAGSQYAGRGEIVAETRKSLLAILAERRAAKGNAESCPAICAALAGQIESMLDSIREAREERAKLAAGDFEGLIFYPDKEARAAFNEGAGETVLA